jgi:hypothetical protein
MTTAFSALVGEWPVSIASSRRLVLPSWYSRMTPWSFSSAWSTSIDSAMRLFCQLATSDGAGRWPMWVVYSVRSFSAIRCIRASARNCSVVPA